jgi:hypothetical protein
VWNWEYNKTLAKQIKDLGIKCYIVFGGPQVSNRPFDTNFFKCHPYVDSIILGEGEESFASLLKNYLENKTQRIYQVNRLNELDIPSPYLTGVFDEIIINNPTATWNTVLETNRGCPFACTFCDWGSLTYTKIKKFPIDRIYAELEWLGKNQIDYLAFSDANFGIFKQRDYAIAEKLCEIKKNYGFPNQLNISFNKNSTKEAVDIVKLLSDSELSRGMTLSFQSLDDTVLNTIKRKNMDINNAKEIFHQLDTQSLTYYSELIIGLPDETLLSWKQGLFKLLSLGQHQCIDIFYSMLLENSEMNNPTYRQKHGLKFVELENFMHINFVHDDQIVEKTKITRATNTMSESELVDAFMFSWIIINLHSYGWAQIYARFLNARGISYDQFYNVLSDWIINNKLGIISEMYQKYKLQTILYLDNHKEFIKQGFSQDTLRDVQQQFHKIKLDIELLLKTFVQNNFYNDIEQLAIYQKHFVADATKSYPYKIDLDIGIHQSIVHQRSYIPEITPCTVSLTAPFTSQNEFYIRLVTWRRNGWGRTIIKADSLI